MQTSLARDCNVVAHKDARSHCRVVAITERLRHGGSIQALKLVPLAREELLAARARSHLSRKLTGWLASRLLHLANCLVVWLMFASPRKQHARTHKQQHWPARAQTRPEEAAAEAAALAARLSHRPALELRVQAAGGYTTYALCVAKFVLLIVLPGSRAAANCWTPGH